MSQRSRHLRGGGRRAAGSGEGVAGAEGGASCAGAAHCLLLRPVIELATTDHLTLFTLRALPTSPLSRSSSSLVHGPVRSNGMAVARRANYAEFLAGGCVNGGAVGRSRIRSTVNKDGVRCRALSA